MSSTARGPVKVKSTQTHVCLVEEAEEEDLGAGMKSCKRANKPFDQQVLQGERAYIVIASVRWYIFSISKSFDDTIRYRLF